MVQLLAVERLTESETIGFMREWLHEHQDLIMWEIIMQDLAKTAKPLPNNQCGQCAAYKTPFCIFSNYNDIIQKKDQCCGSFYPDRHIPRDRLKKPRQVEKRIGRR